MRQREAAGGDQFALFRFVEMMAIANGTRGDIPPGQQEIIRLNLRGEGGRPG